MGKGRVIVVSNCLSVFSFSSAGCEFSHFVQQKKNEQDRKNKKFLLVFPESREGEEEERRKILASTLV